MQVHPEHSPNEAVHAAAGAHINVNRFTQPGARGVWILIGTLLGLSLLSNVFLFEYARDAKTLAMVAQNDLKDFMTSQLPDLKTRIMVTEALVNTYGLKKEIVDERERNDHNQPGNRSAGSH